MAGDSTLVLPERPLDTRIEIVTPENIAFEYRLAGPFRRLPAYLLDVIVQVIVWVVAALGVELTGTLLAPYFGAWLTEGVGWGALLTFTFLLTWFYGGFFETVWNGQTPGKRVFQLRVLTVDGQPINAQQAVLRNLLRAVDWLPVMPPYGLALVTAACTERFQRLGDLACGTMVVVEESRGRGALARVDEPEVLRLAAALPAGASVSPALARALSSYVVRRRTLPWGRRVEIARHLAEPLRKLYGLPAATSYDLLLCALYYRTFIADRPPDERSLPAPADPRGAA